MFKLFTGIVASVVRPSFCQNGESRRLDVSNIDLSSSFFQNDQKVIHLTAHRSAEIILVVIPTGRYRLPQTTEGYRERGNEDIFCRETGTFKDSFYDDRVDQNISFACFACFQEFCVSNVCFPSSFSVISAEFSSAGSDVCWLWTVTRFGCIALLQ